MKAIPILLGSLLLAATATLCTATWGIFRLVHSVDAFLAASAPPPQVWRAVDSLPGIVNKRLGEAIAEIRAVRVSTSEQVTGARQDIVSISAKLDPPLEALTLAVGNLSQIRDDLQPALQETRRALENVTLTTHDLRPQLLGLVAAGKVTLGQAALTAREVERATPDALASFKNIELSLQGSASTFDKGFPAIVSNVGGIAANVNTITKPHLIDRFLKFGVSGAAAYGALK